MPANFDLSGSCDLDYGAHYLGYRERITISNGAVRCVETGIIIPSGVPYADCRTSWVEYSDRRITAEQNAKLHDGASYAEVLNPIDFEDIMPQCLEVWRFARWCRRHGGACLPFGGIEEEFEGGKDDDRNYFIAWLKYRKAEKKARTRIDSGRGPGLTQYEWASLMSGEFVPYVPMSDGNDPYSI